MLNNGKVFREVKAMKFLSVLMVFVSAVQFTCFADGNISDTPRSEFEDGFETVIGTQAVTEITGAEITDYDNGAFKAVTMAVGDSVTFGFFVPTDGEYNISVNFKPLTEASGQIQQTLEIDGTQPFEDISYFSYKRSVIALNKGKTDLAGNDIQPDDKYSDEWSYNDISDPLGFRNGSLDFSLSSGNHTITLTNISGELAIKDIKISQSRKLPDYGSYINSFDGIKSTAEEFEIEAEDYYSKSDISIRLQNDRTSATVTPQSSSTVKLNTIGGSSWKQVGQCITWNFNVENDGFYNIALDFKKNITSGIYSSRRLLIDGETPFEEVACLKFNYDEKWQRKLLGNESENYSFYLSKGSHTLSLEVVLGDVSDILKQVEESLEKLNEIYRKILMITGSSPDTYRNYHFDTTIPNELEELKRQSELLSNTVDRLEKESGSGGSYVSILNQLAFQTALMGNNHEKIAENFEQFKSNLGALGTWLLSAKEQPLQLDKIYFIPAGGSFPDKSVSFFENVMFKIKCFLYSFISDYSAVGKTAELENASSIDVWIQSGRDQAQILGQLIDSEFIPLYGINVDMKLVTADSLLTAVLTGSGPDVALGQAESTPIDYALRGAVEDLSQFDDFEDVKAQFSNGVMQAYEYRGKVFGLPETFDFPVFFYRTDIFAELGLSAPVTWDDFMKLIPVIQSHNMDIAFPTGLSGYSLLLYQNGGALYNNNGESTALDTDIALSSMEEFTNLFTMYRFPVTYDFPNRFRTGEMPCGIQNYSVYNNLTAFAPEIKGNWTFVPVPGKSDTNGNINNVSVGTSTAVMLMKGADANAGWNFIKWWLSAETQSNYGVRMESVLGIGGKQPTANIAALSKMNWSSNEYKSLVAQNETSVCVNQVPGGYYTSRVVQFAFNDTYNNLSDPIENLEEYIDELNEELQRKRSEFDER